MNGSRNETKRNGATRRVPLIVQSLSAIACDEETARHSCELVHHQGALFRVLESHHTLALLLLLLLLALLGCQGVSSRVHVRLRSGTVRLRSSRVLDTETLDNTSDICDIWDICDDLSKVARLIDET